MTTLTTREQYEELKNKVDTYIIYKHSPTCLESAKAYIQMEISEEIINIYILDVLNTWNLKHDIANDLDITHESPQAIMIKDKKIVSEAHHQSISTGRVKQYILWWNDNRKNN